jgi:RND family efflux transporter MFP subunit
MRKQVSIILLGLISAGTSWAQPVSGLVFPFREVSISSPVENFITQLHVREGAEVEAGQQMAQLYVRSVELGMERSAAALRKREFESHGAQNLYREKLISEDDALASEIELRLAKLQYEIAKEAVELRKIRAPISGIVVERNNEIGEMVAVGEPMFRVVDIDQIYIRLFLTVEDARSFPMGRLVDLTFPELLEGDTALRGTVDFVDPRVDSASGFLQVRVLADNTDHCVKPGLRAYVELAPEEEVAPVEAVDESLSDTEPEVPIDLNGSEGAEVVEIETLDQNSADLLAL